MLVPPLLLSASSGQCNGKWKSFAGVFLSISYNADYHQKKISDVLSAYLNPQIDCALSCPLCPVCCCSFGWKATAWTLGLDTCSCRDEVECKGSGGWFSQCQRTASKSGPQKLCREERPKAGSKSLSDTEHDQLKFLVVLFRQEECKPKAKTSWQHLKEAGFPDWQQEQKGGGKEEKRICSSSDKEWTVHFPPFVKDSFHQLLVLEIFDSVDCKNSPHSHFCHSA